MKRLLLIPVLLLGLFCSAQTMKSWQICVSDPQVKTAMDSIILSSTLTTTDTYTSITWAVTPTVTLPTPVVSYLTGISATSKLSIKSLPTGSYTFTSTGKSASGITGSVSTTVLVNPPAVLRYVTGVASKIVSGLVTLVFTYSDGNP